MTRRGPALYLSSAVLVALVLVFSRASAGIFLPPAIDGDLRDWANDGQPVAVAACAERISLRITLPAPVVLQDGSGVIIYYDTDDDASTGLSTHGLGAEIVWDAGLRSGTAYASDAGIITANSIRHPDLELRASPVLDSADFEVSIRRPATVGARCRVAVEWNGELVGVAIGTYREEHVTRSSYPARPAHADLRVLAYNVLFDGLFGAPDKTQRFLEEFAALQPDIICFTEIYRHTAEVTRARVSEALPYMSHASGDGSRDCRIVSRHPILFSEHNGSFHCARVCSEDGAVDVMVITAHFRCCGADDIRAGEMDSIRGFITRLRTGELTGVPADLPVILAGDLNLVREDSAAFLALQQNTGLRPLPALHLDSLDDYTWRRDASDYSPGRLDYILSGPGLVARRAFVYKSAAPPSDHLPLVADLGVDADGNGLGDLWERHYFGATGQSIPSDPDRDGFTNADEQRLGTDPTARGSRPEMVARVADGRLQLRMLGGGPGRPAFRLWRSDDLLGWQTVPGLWRAGDNLSLGYPTIGRGFFWAELVTE